MTTPTLADQAKELLAKIVKGTNPLGPAQDRNDAADARDVLDDMSPELAAAVVELSAELAATESAYEVDATTAAEIISRRIEENAQLTARLTPQGDAGEIATQLRMLMGDTDIQHDKETLSEAADLIAALSEAARQAEERVKELEAALTGLLEHACIADAAPGDVREERRKGLATRRVTYDSENLSARRHQLEPHYGPNAADRRKPATPQQAADPASYQFGEGFTANNIKE